MLSQHTQFADQKPAFVTRDGADLAYPRRPVTAVAKRPQGLCDLHDLERIAHLPDAEFLDLLLAYVTDDPQNTEISVRLLRQFGDLGHLLNARASILRSRGGLSDAQVLLLKLFAHSAQRLMRSQIRNMPVLSGSQVLLDYCHAAVGYHDTEQFRVLFLDRKNRLIADEVLGEGTVDHVPVYPREVIRRALELNACALILVHNHPSGDPTPSEADIAMTHRIQCVAEALSIAIHDHVIIGKSREVSFRAEGLLSD